MWANRFTQVDTSNHLELVEIHDVDVVAVRSWTSHSNIAVNRHISESSVLRYRNFMAIYANRNRSQGLAPNGVDKLHGVVMLVDNNELA
jgi:hypothetical protein